MQGAITRDPTSVLLVVDVQNGFVNASSERVVPVIRTIAQRWKDSGGTIVATRFRNPDDGPWERLIHWYRFKESPEIDLVDDLVGLPDYVIDKYSYSSFTDQFAALQSEHGWTTLVLCGIATDGCVLKTAVDAFERGLRPVVLRDGCASHAGEAVHEAGLLLISRFVGKDQIIDSSDLDVA